MLNCVTFNFNNLIWLRSINAACLAFTARFQKRMTGPLYTVGAPRWSESEFLPNFSLKTGDEVNQNTSFGLDDIAVKSWVLWWCWAHSGGQVASYKCPSPASTTAVVALDHRCINFLAEAEKADSLVLSLSLSPYTFKLFASCGLRHFRPCVIYNELVITAKSYLRVVTEASCRGVH